MIALRVSLNGKLLCVAGAEDLAILNTIINAGGPLGTRTKKNHPDEVAHVYLTVGGLTGREDHGDEHLRWAEGMPLQPGNKVEIEILRTSDVDPPKTARPLDKEKQVQREREQFNYAKEVYHALKSKFEPDQPTPQ